jgi:hypothetical protein
LEEGKEAITEAFANYLLGGVLTDVDSKSKDGNLYGARSGRWLIEEASCMCSCFIVQFDRNYLSDLRKQQL